MPQIQRKVYSLLTIATSSINGLIFGLWYKNILIGLSFTIFIWLAYTALVTDLNYRKIPSGACWIVLTLNSLIIGFFSIHNKTYIPVLAASISVLSVIFTAVVLVFATKGEFGSGDVRLMLVIASMAAWVGYVPILLGVALSSVLQLPLRIILKKFGKYDGPGLPFAPALIIGTLISIILIGHPGTVCNEFGAALSCYSNMK